MVVSGTITTHKTVVIMTMMTLQQNHCAAHAKVTLLLIMKFLGTEIVLGDIIKTFFNYPLLAPKEDAQDFVHAKNLQKNASPIGIVVA